MHIITIGLEKGGVGKSTSALMISDYLHRAGKRVLLLDLDAQSNPTAVLRPDYADELLSDALEQATALPVLKTEWGFDLCPGDNKTAITLRGIDLEALARVDDCIQEMKDEYDIIIIDCPPAFGTATASAMFASDYIIVPFIPGPFELQGLRATNKNIRSIRKYNPRLNLLGVILNQYWSGRLVSTQFKDYLSESYGEKLFEPPIPYAEPLKQALLEKVSIETYRQQEPTKSAAAAEAYEAISKQILERING